MNLHDITLHEILVNLHLSDDHAPVNNINNYEDDNQDIQTDLTSLANINNTSNNELLIQAAKTNKPPSLPKPTNTGADIRNILPYPTSNK